VNEISLIKKVATRFHVPIRSGLVSSDLRTGLFQIFSFEKQIRIQDAKTLIYSAQIFKFTMQNKLNDVND
jgi:hypothetical protein